MEALKNQIVVNPKSYEERFGLRLPKSTEDAFNDILSNFSINETDKSYNSDMNQYLKNSDGDIYYFDNFKYVYPRRVSGKSEIQVLNANIGVGEFCRVRYTGTSIITERYDVSGYGKVEISSYFMTNESRALLESEFVKNDIGNFLLQVSGNHPSFIGKLQLGSKITVRNKNGNLVSYDANENVLDSVVAETNSFYRNVEKRVNYCQLLDKIYSQNLNNEPTENRTPTM